MSRTGRVRGAFAAAAALAAACAVARAEGIGADTKGASGRDRLYAAQTVMSVPDGSVVAIGGPALRRRPAGASRWEALHTVAGDDLYRVAADDGGRLLAVWSKEPLIHLFSPADKLHVTFPKPKASSAEIARFDIAGVAFAPSGLDALVTMTGTVQVTTGRERGPSWSTSVYKVALDGKSPARLLFRLDHAYLLQVSPRGLVFAMNKYPGRRCDHQECLVSAIVAYELAGDGVTARTLLDASSLGVNRVRVMRGSDERRVAVMLDAGLPRHLEVLRWRYGEAKAERRAVNASLIEDQTRLLYTKSGDVVELRRVDGKLEVWRHGAGGDDTKTAELRELRHDDLHIYGYGERADGAMWLHWGDHLGLLSAGGQARSYDLAALVTKHTEFGGDVYIKDPEELWVAIESRGRDYARVSFADAEKRAKPWPGGADLAVVGTGGEGDVTYAKDPSTRDRLYATTGLRPIPGGLLSVGGKVLRRLPTGASRWEVVHAVPGDSLYRVAADDAGRLLAAWEQEPVFHFFAPAQKLHVTLPKPEIWVTSYGKQYNTAHVEQLDFSDDGRDALVVMSAQIGASSHFITAAYLIALDGKSPARQIFQVNEGLWLRGSRHAHVFAMPADPKQECSFQTCWPIKAIVAYEIAGDRVTQRTLFTGDRVAEPRDLSSVMMVRGSNDDAVALVFNLVERRGKMRLNGGRALLRWRRSDQTVDFRMLPGNSSLMPTWLLTSKAEFIEAQHIWDGQERIELHRYPYPPASGEQTTTLKAMDHRPSPYGIGERADGGLWLQWGDRLVLVPPGDKPARSYNLEPVMQRGWEWAGAHVYVKDPESLWVGLDGRGRQYVRVDLADAERRSQTWR